MRFLNLFSCCYFTDGAKLSTVIDTERGVYCQIPKELSLFIQSNLNKDLDVILTKYDISSVKNIEKYLNFLVLENFIFFTKSKQKNISIRNEKYSSSFHIEDIILDSQSTNNVLDSLEKLDFVFESLQLRLFFSPKIEELVLIIERVLNQDLLSLEIIVQKNELYSTNEYLNFYLTNKIIARLVVTNCSLTEKFENEEVYFVKSKLIDKKNCGIISESLFHPNLRTYLTSKSCNSCLNLKISIDQNGEIRNCPSMPQSYGNIKDTTLQEALNKPGFKKYWNLTKDEIEVCKDCEFRYICTDCRAYTERTHTNQEGLDISKPLKCGYNPYTGEWAEWSTNPLKQKAIEFYGF
ncbi:MAG: grasp-with-spasm system SPASM domain peptide maturase [Flavobacteriaceae bacterium]|nr:grasp-with-spasm system SPASM domain peptide maturase [Flavobacteriaceae bacterium]